MHLMDSSKVSRMLALAGLVACTSAWGSFSTPHYLGHSRQQSEFRVYLGGGAFLGRAGSLQTIRVTIHQLRKGQPLRALEGCVYRFDDTDRRRDRIECADGAPGPLSGVEYARDPKQGEKASDETDLLMCVRGCSRHVPQRLHLEDADEDNG